MPRALLTSNTQTVDGRLIGDTFVETNYGRKAEIAERKALYTYTFFLEGYPCPHPYRKAPY